MSKVNALYLDDLEEQMEVLRSTIKELRTQLIEVSKKVAFHEEEHRLDRSSLRDY